MGEVLRLSKNSRDALLQGCCQEAGKKGLLGDWRRKSYWFRVRDAIFSNFLTTRSSWLI